jgi:2-amino-4-hydroxy-6-hydroxymethyldihydropteridine diphosphokinase
MIRCFVGLGSNLADPEQQIRNAVTALQAHTHLQFIALSPLYRNAAIGPGSQPDYVNGVVELRTALEALVLLQKLQSIENAQERVRTEHWGARTLDLDLLLYGGEIIDSATLNVPHPRMTTRNFVLYPLYDLAPDLTLPDGTPLRALLDCCPGAGLQRI